MLAEARRGHVDRLRLVSPAPLRRGAHLCAKGRVLDLLERATGRELRVLADLLQIEHGARGHAVVLQQRLTFAGGALRGPGLDVAVDLVVAIAAALCVCVVRVAVPVR